MILGTIIIAFSALLSLNVLVTGEWVPNEDELAPTQDAYLSVAGVLASPDANFGGASSLTVGKGIDGHSVTVIQFNLTGLPALKSLTFVSEVTVYGEETRTVKVKVFTDVAWDEYEVTGLNNPFDALDFLSSPANNATMKIQVTGSTEEISIDLSDYKDHDGTITLLFAGSLTDESWLTMPSKENQYLTRFSNPPHLEFEIESASRNNSGTANIDVISVFLAMTTFSGTIILRKKIKNSAN